MAQMGELPYKERKVSLIGKNWESRQEIQRDKIFYNPHDKCFKDKNISEDMIV